MKTVLAVAALCVLLAGSSAFAAVTTSLTAPTGDSVLTPGSAASDAATPLGRYSGIANTPGQWMGHGANFGTKSASDNTNGLQAGVEVGRFTLKMVPGATFADISGEPMMATVLTVADDNGCSLTSTLTPWTVVGNMPTLTDATTPVYVTFEIPAFTVLQGTQYAILVNFANQDATNLLGDGTQSGLGGFVENGGNVVGNSIQCFALNGSGSAASFTADSDDTVFWLQTPVPQDVPEPATMALLAVGAVGALIRRKK